MRKVLAFLAMLGLLAGGTQAIALDTTGLVGAWLLDDGNGQTLKDSSDNGPCLAKTLPMSCCFSAAVLKTSKP